MVTTAQAATAQQWSYRVVAAAPNPHADQAFYTLSQNGLERVFNSTQFGGKTAQDLRSPMADITSDPNGGVWMVSRDGGVFAYGAPFYGALPSYGSFNDIVGLAATQDNNGYWLAASNGRVFAFGDATSQHLYSPVYANIRVVGIQTGTFAGFSLVMSNGSIEIVTPGNNYTIPPTARPVVSGCADPQVANTFFTVTRGGVIYPEVLKTFGGYRHNDRHFSVTSPLDHTSYPVVSIVCTPDGNYVWVIYSDGGAQEEAVTSYSYQ